MKWLSIFRLQFLSFLRHIFHWLKLNDNLKSLSFFQTWIELDTPYVKGTFIDSHKPTVALYNAFNTSYHLFNILSYVFFDVVGVLCRKETCVGVDGGVHNVLTLYPSFTMFFSWPFLFQSEKRHRTKHKVLMICAYVLRYY